MLDYLQDTAVGQPISINAFCGENESRDYIFTISVSKSFWEEMDAAAVVSGSVTLCFLFGDRAAGSRNNALPLRFRATILTTGVVVLVDVFHEDSFVERRASAGL